jgi:hypothetical protein
MTDRAALLHPLVVADSKDFAIDDERPSDWHPAFGSTLPGCCYREL